MKKSFIFLAAWILAFPVFAQAPVFYSEYGQRFISNDGTQTMVSFTVDAISENLVTADNDLTIILNEPLSILFEKESEWIFEGTAASKISDLTFSEDLTKATIDVKETWTKGDSLVIRGIQVRIYDRGGRHFYIGLDTTGDSVADYDDINSIFIDETSPRNDLLAPYPVENVQGVYDGTKVIFTWENPVDPDCEQIRIIKKVNNNIPTELSLGQVTTWTDTNINKGDVVEYTIHSSDLLNLGEGKIITIDTNESSQETEETIEENIEEDTEEEAVIEDEETTEETTENNVSETITREELKIKAASVWDIEKPIDRIKFVREEMKKLEFKNKVWFMRFIKSYKSS